MNPSVIVSMTMAISGSSTPPVMLPASVLVLRSSSAVLRCRWKLYGECRYARKRRFEMSTCRPTENRVRRYSRATR